MSRALHTLMLVAVLLQGGALTPCHWEALLGEAGDRSAGCSSTHAASAEAGVWANCHETSGESDPCLCEYRKTEAQPQRLAEVQLNLLAPLAFDHVSFQVTASTHTALAPPFTAPIPPPDAGRCLPLLI